MQMKYVWIVLALILFIHGICCGPLFHSCVSNAACNPTCQCQNLGFWKVCLHFDHATVGIIELYEILSQIEDSREKDLIRARYYYYQYLYPNYIDNSTENPEKTHFMG